MFQHSLFSHILDAQSAEFNDGRFRGPVCCHTVPTLTFLERRELHNGIPFFKEATNISLL